MDYGDHLATVSAKSSRTASQVSDIYTLGTTYMIIGKILLDYYIQRSPVHPRRYPTHPCLVDWTLNGTNNLPLVFLSTLIRDHGLKMIRVVTAH